MYTEVLNYRLFLNSLPKKIKKSSFKANKIIEKTGMSKASFYKKLKSKNFNIDEVEKISKVLYIEEMINAELSRSMKESEEGKTMTERESQSRLQKIVERAR